MNLKKLEKLAKEYVENKKVRCYNCNKADLPRNYEECPICKKLNPLLKYGLL